MVLVGKRCLSGSAAPGPIDLIWCGVRLPVALVLQPVVPCARRNSGKVRKGP